MHLQVRRDTRAKCSHIAGSMRSGRRRTALHDQFETVSTPTVRVSVCVIVGSTVQDGRNPWPYARTTRKDRVGAVKTPIEALSTALRRERTVLQQGNTADVRAAAYSASSHAQLPLLRIEMRPRTRLNGQELPLLT